jgi:murein DD-endopeptidase MepM/ murein hydrolase activator NlpD
MAFPIRVEANTTIGAIGAYGRLNGPHLHVELWQNGFKHNPAFILK